MSVTTRTLAPILAESTMRTTRITRHRFYGISVHAAHERAEAWLALLPSPFGSCREVRHTPRGYCVTVHVLRWGESDRPTRHVQPVIHTETDFCPPPGWHAKVLLKGVRS